MSRPKSKVPPHPFRRDPDLPPDRDGRGTCRCGLVGEPGDAHHSMPTIPEQAEHAARYERDGDEQ